MTNSEHMELDIDYEALIYVIRHIYHIGPNQG